MPEHQAPPNWRGSPGSAKCLASPILGWFSVNFLGAPALSLEEFANYEQNLILGASLEVSAPLGQYDPSKLLNIGTNRWLIKPELGASKALGPVTLETSAAVTFFTTNDDFLGGNALEQEPFYSVQGHLIYEIRPGLWRRWTLPTTPGGARSPRVKRARGWRTHAWASPSRLP